MIGQTFLFSHCISTLFIWCCRVCHFAWWRRVLLGNHATLVFIEKMGDLEKLCLRAPKSLIWHCQHRIKSALLRSRNPDFQPLTRCCVLKVHSLVSRKD